MARHQGHDTCDLPAWIAGAGNHFRGLGRRQANDRSQVTYPNPMTRLTGISEPSGAEGALALWKPILHVELGSIVVA